MDDVDNSAPWITLQDLVHHINTHERPRDEFRAAMVFILSTLAIDPDDLNQVLCEAFTIFEEGTVARRRKHVDEVLEKAAAASGVKGKPSV